jgi:hypothetical protein
MMQSAQRLQAFAPGDTIDFAKDHRRRDPQEALIFVTICLDLTIACVELKSLHTNDYTNKTNSGAFVCRVQSR